MLPLRLISDLPSNSGFKQCENGKVEVAVEVAVITILLGPLPQDANLIDILKSTWGKIWLQVMHITWVSASHKIKIEYSDRNQVIVEYLCIYAFIFCEG